MRKLAILSIAILFLAIATNAAQADLTYRNPPKYIKQELKATFGKQWKKAAEVAWCESKYNLRAINSSSTGLMQIDAPGGGRYLNGKYFSRQYLFTLKGNLKAARILWIAGGRSFYTHWRWSYHCWG